MSGHNYEAHFIRGNARTGCSCGWDMRGGLSRENWRKRHMEKIGEPVRHDNPVYFNDDPGNTIIRCCDCGWETNPSQGPAFKQFETHREVFGGG